MSDPKQKTFTQIVYHFPNYGPVGFLLDEEQGDVVEYDIDGVDTLFYSTKVTTEKSGVKRTQPESTITVPSGYLYRVVDTVTRARKDTDPVLATASD